MIKEIEAEAKEEADKKAKEYVVNAIQRCAADHCSEATISVVQLPGDEMKGRIIGREGRNIRTLETMTGVDLIIDDTPEAVVISAFDPIRREVARVALEKLIVDGRIHPARIEEMVTKSQREVEARIKEEGEAATLEVGVHGIHPELVRLPDFLQVSLDWMFVLPNVRDCSMISEKLLTTRWKDLMYSSVLSFAENTRNHRRSSIPWKRTTVMLRRPV